MKIYKCDRCGREVVETFGHDVLDDEDWLTVYYDENDEPFHYYYDDAAERYYTKQQVACVKHFCPSCY